MRNLLIVVQIFLLFFVVGQDPDSLKLINIDKPITIDKIEMEIKKTALKNEIKLKEAAELKRKNDEELLKIEQMKAKKEQLVESAIKKIKLLLQKKKTKKSLTIPLQNSLPQRDYFVVDSICTDYSRNFMGINRCSKWEFKYTKVDLKR